MRMINHNLANSNYTTALQIVLFIVILIIIVKVLFGKSGNLESNKDFALRNVRLSYENGSISKEKYEEGIKEIENNL